MASAGTDCLELKRRFRELEIEVKYKTGGSDKHIVRVRPNDSFKKIKRHISESLDIQGKLMYGDENLDAVTKKIADHKTKEEINFYMMCPEKKRSPQHSIEVQLPEAIFGMGGRSSRVEMKVSRTTTVSNLKHKIQDMWGLTCEEQTIHMLGSSLECQGETNIMQLKQPIKLEVKMRPREPAITRVRSYSDPTASRGTIPVSATTSSTTPKKLSPYAVKTSRRGQALTKTKPSAKTKDTEKVTSSMCVPLHHASYETLYQLGRNLEEFKKEKQKSLVIKCTHKEGDKVNIESKLVDVTQDSDATSGCTRNNMASKTQT